MKPHAKLLIVMAMLWAISISAWGIERFPPPDFSQHALPETVMKPLVSRGIAWLDITLLVVALAAAAWLSLKLRSRRGMVLLSLASLAYFGFWRQGCVCAIGSIQNVAQAVGDSNQALPMAVLAFFALPLAATLLTGRGFCAGVCPHGAIQDLLLIRPIKVPVWLDEILRILPWLYLAAAVLIAATGGIFIICQFDPWVGIFRMSGSRGMLIAGAALVLLSMFVGRPYCRYLCPYGALLGCAARVAKWHPVVTPSACSQCRLCEDSCPFGALNAPQPANSPAKPQRSLLLIILGVMLALGIFAWIGGALGGMAFPHVHPNGKLLSYVIEDEIRGGQWPGATPDVLLAYRQHGSDREALMAAASLLESRFVLWGRWLGACVGLVLVLKLRRIVFPARSTDYETDDGRCLACARCFMTCPYERMRRGMLAANPTPDDANA